MRTLFVFCIFALIFGVYAGNLVGVCQFTGNFTGTVTFTEITMGFDQPAVIVSGSINSTTVKEERGLHIHQYGDIRTSESAGSHFNPYNQLHGCLPSTQIHLGDLGNINFTASGTARETTIYVAQVNFTIIGASLRNTEEYTLIGRTLVLHGMKDNCTSTTTTFGNRDAQCVIGFMEGNVGFINTDLRVSVPDAICVFDAQNYITFSQNGDWNKVDAVLSTNQPEDLYLSTEPVNSTDFDDTKSIPLFTDSKLQQTIEGLSLRYQNETIVGIIGKAVYYTDGSKYTSCVIGFMNPGTPGTTTTTTTSSPSDSASASASSTTTGADTTGAAATTGAVTTVTTAVTTVMGSTSTIGTTSTTGVIVTTGADQNNTSSDDVNTSGQTPALNTTDTSGGAVLGIIFTTFILVGLAWYTYANRGNNQRRLGYFGV